MMTDSQFARAFGKLIAFLVVLTIVLIALGAMIGGSIDDKLKAQTEEYTQRMVASRTEPVGQMNVGSITQSMPASESGTTTEAATEVTQVAAADENRGQEVYDTACYICHNVGLTGAPKPGDGANWNPRIQKGVDILYNNAILGYQGQFGIMPPKGGNLLLTDDDVRAAVDYLIELVQ